MVRINDYYTEVYRNFIVKNEREFSNAIYSYNETIIFPKDEYSELIDLLDDIYRRYDFNLHRQCQPNYEQFYLWQKYVSGSVDSNSIKAAIEFVLFCCLADKFLDSPRFSLEEKQQICNKLNVSYFIQKDEFVSNCFCEMDVFLNHIRKYLQQHQNAPIYKSILESISKAFISEIYMGSTWLASEESVMYKDLPLLVDKSIEFEKTAFLLAVLSVAGTEEVDTAHCIAEIIWLIDDLCDFVEDVQCKRKNSLLFYCTNPETNMCLSKRIELTVYNLSKIYAMLESRLQLLKEKVDVDLYNFLVIQVWEWCSNVRKAVETQNEKKTNFS